MKRCASIVGIAIAACTGPANPPTVTPPTRPPGPHAVSTAAPAPASQPVADRVDAPPTPARKYDAAACTDRTQRFAQQVKAAYDFVDARSSFDYRRDLVAAAPDPALVAPPVTVELGRVAPPCPASWAAKVIGAGPTLTVAGSQRLADTTAAVMQRLPSKSAIGVDIRASIDLAVLEPVLVELSTIGPLQLAIAVEGMPFPVAVQETPAWVLERIRATRAASLPERPLVKSLVRDANLGCIALQPVVEAMNAEVNTNMKLFRRQTTEAVAACACSGVDVDALEVAVSLYFAGGGGSLTEGWLEFRVDPTSTTVVRAASRLQLVAALASVPRAQRAAGVKLELQPRRPTPTPIDARCL